MAYNILSVRKPGDPPDPHYPSLGDRLLPEMSPGDGADVRMHSLQGIVVTRRSDAQSKKVIGANGVSGEIWITDARVIVRCKNYDKVRWSGEYAVDELFFGVGFATTEFLASKAYHRMKSMGKAMIGHLYLPWIAGIAYQPFIRGNQFGSVRVLAKSKQMDGNTKTLVLTTHLHKSEDPRAVAEHLYERTCAWWMRKPAGVTDDMLPNIQEKAQAKFKVPPPGEMSLLQLPYYRFTNSAKGLI